MDFPMKNPPLSMANNMWKRPLRAAHPYHLDKWHPHLPLKMPSLYYQPTFNPPAQSYLILFHYVVDSWLIDLLDVQYEVSRTSYVKVRGKAYKSL
jgi:hypothetical protein